jgi:hypothetical protein
MLQQTCMTAVKCHATLQVLPAVLHVLMLGTDALQQFQVAAAGSVTLSASCNIKLLLWAWSLQECCCTLESTSRVENTERSSPRQ